MVPTADDIPRNRIRKNKRLCNIFGFVGLYGGGPERLDQFGDQTNEPKGIFISNTTTNILINETECTCIS